MSLLWLLFPILLAADDAAQWLIEDGRAYLPIPRWEQVTGYRAFADEKSGRVLLERKERLPVILLIDTPYALVGSKFLALPDAPVRRGNQILLSSVAAERVFQLPAGEQTKFTELLATARSAPPPPGAPSPVPAPAPAAPDAHPPPCQLQRPVKRVFLDPGHGGSDVGTKAGGVNEKTIVLAFARRAADELRRRGFEVSFSRSRDVFLPLDVRSRLAEEWKADLFISLHVNSSTHAHAHGTETYILSQDATDAEARKLALIENSVATTARAKQSAVQDILWDMEQTAFLQDSAYLAAYLQGALVGAALDLLHRRKISGDWKNRGVRQAPFYVLNRAAMPAVLVELAYLSNSRDRKLLQDKTFQDSLARALAEGVKKYGEVCRKAL